MGSAAAAGKIFSRWPVENSRREEIDEESGRRPAATDKAIYREALTLYS
jgi:hypothetical protein